MGEEQTPEAIEGESSEPRLTDVTLEQAQRFTRELDWASSLEGYFYLSGPGSVSERMMKLADLAHLLEIGAFDVDPRAARAWIAETIGDVELAERIDGALSEHAWIADGRRQVLELLIYRLSQCESLIAPPEPTEESGNVTTAAKEE